MPVTSRLWESWKQQEANWPSQLLLISWAGFTLAVFFHFQIKIAGVHLAGHSATGAAAGKHDQQQPAQEFSRDQLAPFCNGTCPGDFRCGTSARGAKNSGIELRQPCVWCHAHLGDCHLRRHRHRHPGRNPQIAIRPVRGNSLCFCCCLLRWIASLPNLRSRCFGPRCGSRCQQCLAGFAARNAATWQLKRSYDYQLSYYARRGNFRLETGGAETHVALRTQRKTGRSRNSGISLCEFCGISGGYSVPGSRFTWRAWRELGRGGGGSLATGATEAD